ncbi:MAG: GNAT family N-acetyltransferase [Chloroflexota bacterium]
MEIRPGTLADLNVCMMLDASFETEYVWQMEERANNGNITVGLRLTRLPRPMKVTGVISPDGVSHNFMNGGALLVAETGGEICGYVDVSVSEWNQAAMINNLAVAPAFRRRGIASRLLRAALAWGRQNKLRVALLDTSTKAHPAICLYQKHGFAFCGFNDQLYPNRDIALFFALSLR